MNRKLIRTGIFSITALLGLALASPTTAFAHGRGYQHRMNMPEDRYSYQQSGVDDADDEPLQEWEGHHNSMH